MVDSTFWGKDNVKDKQCDMHLIIYTLFHNVYYLIFSQSTKKCERNTMIFQRFILNFLILL